MLPIPIKRIVENKTITVWVFALGLICCISGCQERKVVRKTPGMDTAERFWVNVLLFDNIKKCELNGLSAFVVKNVNMGTERRFEETSGIVPIKIKGGNILIGGKYFGKEVMILPDSPHVFSVNRNRYRGNLELVINSDGETFDAINAVPMEAYLAGVVGAEMPDYWEMDALKAQAVAARTYCMYIKNRFGVNRRWDVRKTQASQVYRGLSAETPRIWDAVDQTKGEFLMCLQENGGMEIFPTFYCSICGGHTENSKNVFGDSYVSLSGVECRYCKKVARMSFFFWRDSKFDEKKVSESIMERYPRLQKLGKIVRIEPDKKSQYKGFSRITSVKLVGEKGKEGSLRGEDLRLTIDPTGMKIKSIACNILKTGGKYRFSAGRGFGHGVGMCQYGAEGLAREGKTAEQILEFYYPDSKTKRLY